MAEKGKTTAYGRLKKAASNYCKTGSGAAKERLQKAEAAYRKNAEKNGKTASEISAVISRTKKCPTKK